MPSLQDFFAWRRARQPVPTEAEVRAQALARAANIPPGSIENSVLTKVMEAAYRAPQFITEPAQALSARLTEPALTRTPREAALRGFIGGAIEGAAELLSPFNVATTAVPVLAPARLSPILGIGIATGSAPLVGQSLAALQDAARQGDAQRIALESAMAGMGALGIAAGLGGALAPRTRPPAVKPGVVVTPPPPPALVGRSPRLLPPYEPPPAAEGPLPLYPRPSVAGLLPEHGTPYEGGAIPLPGETLPPGREPFRGMPTVTPPPPPARVRTVEDVLSAPDDVLFGAYREALTEGRMGDARRIAEEGARRQYFAERFLQIPPEPTTPPPPPPPAPFVFAKPITVMGRRVDRVEFDLAGPKLVVGPNPEDRIRVPWSFLDVLRPQAPGLPTEPQAPAPRGRFDLIPPADRAAFIARVRAIEAQARPERGQQGLIFEGPFRTAAERRAEALGALEAVLAGPPRHVPTELVPPTPTGPSAQPGLPLAAPPFPGATAELAPPPGPLTDLANRLRQPPPPARSTAAPAAPPAPAPRPAAAPAVPPPSEPTPQAVQALSNMLRRESPATRTLGAIEELDPATLRLDPETFQFKESDARGITGSLKGVEKWEPSSPPILVYEAIDGQRYVADGHQRFNKYIELLQKGRRPGPLYGRVLREADGWTIPEVVRLASLRNIQEGSAQPLDIARLIWNGGDLSPDELARIPKAHIVGERLMRGQALGRIQHPRARQMLINKEVDQNYAAFVGQYITDPDAQLAALQRLAKADLDNLRQAEIFVRSLAEGEFEQTSLVDMFGRQDVAIPLAETKAKLGDAARRALHERRAAFAGAVRHADRLAAAGNTLLSEVNVAQLDEAKRLLAYFDKVAMAKGTHTNDALTEAAKAVVSGRAKPADLTDTILDAVQRDLEGAPRVVPREQPAAPGRTGPAPGRSPGEPPVATPAPAEGGRVGGAVAPRPPVQEAVAPRPPVQEAVAPRPPVQEAVAPRPPMKEAKYGQYLAPPDRDYVFVKLDPDFARAHPEVRKALRDAGFAYRRSHEAWFRNRMTLTPEQAEAEALQLLGGPKATEPAPPPPPARAEPTKPAEPTESPPAAGSVRNEFGEEQSLLFERKPVEDSLLRQQEDFLVQLQRMALTRSGVAQTQARASLMGLADELVARLPELRDDTLEILRQMPLRAEQRAAVLGEIDRRRGAKPPDLGDLLGTPARVERPPQAPPPPPAAPAAPQATPPPSPREVTTSPRATEAPRKIPANVRSFLTRQLGYSAEDLAKMTPEEAARIGRERIRKAEAAPVAPPEAGAEATAGSPGPSRPPAPAPAPEPPPAEGPGPAPSSLEELLFGYLREIAPGKMARIRERMGRARPILRGQRVPAARTYRGAEGQDTPILPAREFGPLPARSRAEVKALEEAGVPPDQAEARLLSEAQARAAARASRPKVVETVQEHEAAGLPPPRAQVSQQAAGHPAGLNRLNVRQAHEMREALEQGRLDDYAEMLLRQVERENDAAFAAGSRRESPGKVWGDDFVRLRYDAQTGEYLGSGLGAFEKLLRTNPGLFWRMGGGTLVGLALGDAEELDGPDLLAAALAGGALGAAASPQNLRRLAGLIRQAAPAIGRVANSLRRESLREWKQYETAVRRPRDPAKDLGLVSQLWRSPSYVDPDVFRRAWRLLSQADTAIGRVKDPKTRLLLHRFYRRAAATELRTAARIAERLGFPREARYWRQHAKVVAGQPAMMARWISELAAGEISPKRVEQVMGELERHMYRLTIGWAIDSGLINRTQVLLALPRVGIRSLARGIAAGRTPEGAQQAAQAGLQFADLADLPRREPTAGRELIDAIDRAAFSPMRMSDEANRRDVYLAGLHYARQKGLDPDDATRFAFDLAMQTQGVPGELGYNPYLHQLTPFRGLAKYPVLLAEMFADTLAHPDRRVMLRMLGLLTGAYGLTNLLKLDLMQWLVPRFAIVGPMWDAAVRLVTEEHRHLTQYLPGGEPADHALADELADLVVSRYIKRVYQAVKRTAPREVGGYGYGTGPRPVYDARGRLREVRTALEEFLNLLGIRTTRQSELQKRIEEAYRFEKERRAEQSSESRRAYGELREALERGDPEAIAKAESKLTPSQLRDFYRTAPLPPPERIRRRLPRRSREAYEERVPQ